MPKIETTEDLANQVADWLGVFGCCKHHPNDCSEESEFCCRVGFMLSFPERIRDAVRNEAELEKLNINPDAKI